MPGIEFHAGPGDQRQVLEIIFAQAGIRVLESSSEPGASIQTFSAPDEVPSDALLDVYVEGSGPEPLLRRIELNDGQHRFSVEGWGLISVQFFQVRRSGGLASRIVHQTPARAAQWAHLHPELGDPDAWDWKRIGAVTRAISRGVRSLGVAERGKYVVLTEAAQILEG